VEQLFHPFSLHIIQPFLESIYYGLVNGFELSISLGISWGGISICNFKITAASPKGFTIKLKAIIRDEGTRDPEPSDNVFPKKFLGIYIPYIRQGFSLNLFSEVVYVD